MHAWPSRRRPTHWRYGPGAIRACDKLAARPVGRSSRCDRADVKIRRVWNYLYRAFVREGNTVNVRALSSLNPNVGRVRRLMGSDNVWTPLSCGPWATSSWTSSEPVGASAIDHRWRAVHRPGPLVQDREGGKIRPLPGTADVVHDPTSARGGQAPDAPAVFAALTGALGTQE